MKKRNLLFTLAAAFGFLIFSSYNSGPGTNAYDCSGADFASGSGNPNGCGDCHGSTATAGINVSLAVDSVGGVPVTNYVPGMTYTVTLTGTNTTAVSLPKFGFQVAATLGATAATVPVDAGALQTTGLPTGVHYVSAPRTTATFFASVIEHTTRLSPTTGTGGSGTVYSTTFTWTAPPPGTGVISFWAALNAVNGTGGTGGDYWNVAHITLGQAGTTAPITGSLSVCVGTTNTLADTATGGTWTSGNTSVATVDASGMVTGVAVGTARITYVAPAGITSSVVTVNAAPTAAAITGIDSVCPGHTVTMADATTGGAWHMMHTNAVISVSGVVTGVTTGMDTVYYVVSNTCGADTVKRPVKILSASWCASLQVNEVMEASKGLSIYPNPSGGQFTLELSSLNNGATIMIMDMMGKVVDARFEQNINNRKIDLNLSNLPIGIYLVKVSTGLETFHGKVTIR